MSDVATDRLPVGVMGCGRMGRLHVRTYAGLATTRLVGVYDPRPEASAAMAAEFATRAYESPEALLADAKAVSIASPTTHHVSLAEPALSRGVACLVEKPLAGTSVEAETLVAAARRSGAVLQVGHIERFNPAFVALGKLGITPRFIEAVRISPMTFRSIDVSVVLDMMIHDIDLVAALAGSEPVQVDAVGVGVVGELNDICNARIRFANGCVATLTASRVSAKTERRMKVFARDAYAVVDFARREAWVARAGAGLTAVRAAAAAIRRGETPDVSSLKPEAMAVFEPLTVEPSDPIRSEIESFVDAVTRGTRPAADGVAGLLAVRVAEQIAASIAANG